MKQLFLLLLMAVLLICGCSGEGEKISSHTIKKFPDDQYHAADLRITSGENLLAPDGILHNYIIDQKLATPLGDIAIDPASGALFVIARNNNIIKLDSTGHPLFTIRSHGRGPGEFTLAEEIKIRNGQVYILDTKQNKISVYTLEGTFVRDIIPEKGQIHTFAITAKGQIIAPNLSILYKGAPLFNLYNQEGKKIDQFGNGRLVWDDLKASGMAPEALLNLSGQGLLVLTMTGPGHSYIFNLEKEKLTGSFSIQKGEEWRGRVEATKDSPGWPINIPSVIITPQENILISFGGIFKNKMSIMMMFDETGNFIGRIFGNDQFIYRPTSLSLINDSTLWVYSFVGKQFLRIRLRPAHAGKKQQANAQMPPPH